MTRVATIQRHDGVDWCHFCGERQAQTADVFYAENAENDAAVAARPNYVRVCSACGNAVVEAATGGQPPTEVQQLRAVLADAAEEGRVLWPPPLLYVLLTRAGDEEDWERRGIFLSPEAAQAGIPDEGPFYDGPLAWLEHPADRYQRRYWQEVDGLYRVEEEPLTITRMP